MTETNGMQKIDAKEAEPKSIAVSLSRKEEDKLSKEPLRVEAAPSPFNAPRPPRKSRRYLCGCCISCGVFTVILGIIILVLALTVFKKKDPKITLNSIAIGDLSTGVDAGALTLHVNLTLMADMSVKNPNKAASFKHGSSTTVLTYEGKTIGEAVLPPGKIKADGTSRTNVTVTVYIDGLASTGFQLIRDGFAGSLNMSTTTRMSGRIKLLRLVKMHVTVFAVCDINVNISSKAVQIYHCTTSLKV